MNQNKLPIRLIFLIFLILLLNYFAMNFYWYSSVWYLDMPMHFLGGLWLGLAVVWFFRVEKLSLKSAFGIILGVLLIGILWEVFEILINTLITNNSFNILDTTSDISFDLAGGMLAIFHFMKKVMPIKENTV